MATSNKNFKVKNGLDVGGEINAAAVGGDEGGQLNLAKPATGTTLSGDVAIDIYQNKIRIFDSGGTARGAYIDLSAAGEGVSSNLLAGGGAGISNVVEDTTPQLGGDLDTNGYDITNLNALTLDTSPTGVPTSTGTISWNSTDETLDVKLNSEVTLQAGQEHVVHAKNMTGSTIPDVCAVMFAGASGNKVRITPAVSTSGYEPYTFVGITTQAILDEEFGFVTQFGMINNIDTSAWADGALLYVDPATPGGLTTTVPSAPNWTFPVGAVIASNSTNGKILVRAIPGDHLHDIVDVAISSPADNEVLAYNNETGVWINQTAAEAGLVAEGDARLTNARTPTAHAASHGSAGADAITIAQSQVTDLTADLGDKANLASPTFTGTVTSPVIRLTTTTDASLSSTGHAFQIGASGGTNLVIDNNEIIARNDGETSTLLINDVGGNVEIGGNTGDLINAAAYTTGNDWLALGRSRKAAWIDSNGTLGNAASSSREVKQQINATTYEYDKIISIEPKTFKYNQAVEIMGEDAPVELGFIAEDLHDAGVTELIYYREDGSVEGLDYTKFAVVTQQIVREQHRMIMELKDEIEELKSRL